MLAQLFEFHLGQDLRCEILASGRRLGSSKSKPASLAISDRSIHADVLQLTSRTRQMCAVQTKQTHLMEKLLFRSEVERMMQVYQECWNIAQKHMAIFKGWPQLC